MPLIRQSLAIFYEDFGTNPDHSIRDLWWAVSLCVCVVLCLSFVSNSRLCFFKYLLLNAVCVSRTSTDEL